MKKQKQKTANKQSQDMDLENILKTETKGRNVGTMQDYDVEVVASDEAIAQTIDARFNEAGARQVRTSYLAPIAPVNKNAKGVTERKALDYSATPAKTSNEIPSIEQMPVKEERPAETAIETEPQAESDVLLEVKHLKKYFPVKKNLFGKTVKNLHAVDDVSFVLKKGKTLGIVGESGCGKTTMGRTILRLYEATDGEVWFNGKEVSKIPASEFDKLRPHMQMIFQDPYASLSPRLTVGEIIGEAALQHGIVSKENYRAYVLDVMKMCGLQPHYYERYPHEFSGGQRQRVGIARSIIMKPDLIIADEPVSALDVSIQAQVINLLNDLRNQLGLTILFIAHDLSVVKYFSDRIGVMYFGKMVELASSDELFKHPLHPYTKSLLSAIPLPDPHYEKQRKRITYNPIAEHDYSQEQPTLREVCPGHFVRCNSEELKRYQEQLKNE